VASGSQEHHLASQAASDPPLLAFLTVFASFLPAQVQLSSWTSAIVRASSAEQAASAGCPQICHSRGAGGIRDASLCPQISLPACPLPRVTLGLKTMETAARPEG
jgi:hypothetical protein